MTQIETIDMAMLPSWQWREPDGARRKCLDFHYGSIDPVNDLPKAIRFEGITYIKTGFNSDVGVVHYKQGEPAIPCL